MTTMAWPLPPQTITMQLTSLTELSNKWKSRFSDEGWLSEFDELPESQRVEVFAQFANEMKLAATLAASLVDAVS